MSDVRHVGGHDIEAAYAGWPLPEVLGGAVVGATLVLSVVAVVLRSAIPNEAALAIGAVAGALVSWIHRPRRIALERQRDMVRALTPEERPQRRAA